MIGQTLLKLDSVGRHLAPTSRPTKRSESTPSGSCARGWSAADPSAASSAAPSSSRTSRRSCRDG
jgi:hypothetical protein